MCAMRWITSEANADLLLPDDGCTETLLGGDEGRRSSSCSSPHAACCAGHSTPRVSLHSVAESLRSLSKAQPLRWPRISSRDVGSAAMAVALIILLLRSFGHNSQHSLPLCALPPHTSMTPMDTSRTTLLPPSPPTSPLPSSPLSPTPPLFNLSDVLIGVVTFGARQNRSVPAIMATWGRHFPHILYYSNTSHYPDSTYRITPMPLLADGGPRDYGEMNTLYQLYLHDPHSPWYYKADDDTWINPHRLATLLGSLDPSVPYLIGARLHQHQWPHSYCHGGAGYAISQGLMRLMHPHLLEPLHVGVSDVQVGHIAARYNVSCLHYPSFLSHSMEVYLQADSPHRMSGEEELMRLSTAISFHHVNPEYQWLYEAFMHRLIRADAPSPPLSLHNYNEDIWAPLGPNFIRPHNPWPDLDKFPTLPDMRRSSLASSWMRWNQHCGFDGHVCVIAYSLQSDAPSALAGAEKNAQLIRTLFPGWVARFYHSATVPVAALARLKELGAELREWNISTLLPAALHTAPMPVVDPAQWHLLVAFDESVERYAVRAVEQRLSQREFDAMREWQESAYSVHIMRDHSPSFQDAVTPNMWAAVHGAVDAPTLLILLTTSSPSTLNSTLWSRAQWDQLAHDSRPPSCTAWVNSRPFPSGEKAAMGLVGRVYDESGREVDGGRGGDECGGGGVVAF